MQIKMKKMQDEMDQQGEKEEDAYTKVKREHAQWRQERIQAHVGEAEGLAHSELMNRLKTAKTRVEEEEAKGMGPMGDYKRRMSEDWEKKMGGTGKHSKSKTDL